MGVTRRRLIGSMGFVLVAPALAQSARGPRIGFLGLGNPDSPAVQARVDGLRSGLRELGYAEGKNIHIEYRWVRGDYERLPAMARELLSGGVDLLVTQGTDGTRAAKAATRSVPIVMLGVSDPVATGLVADIARPGGNVTGVMFFALELMQKRLELLAQALPGGNFAALLNPDNASHTVMLPQLQKTAASLGTRLQAFYAKSPGEFDTVFDAMVATRVAGVVIVDDGMLTSNYAAIARLAARRRIAAAGVIEIAGAGGLIGFGINGPEGFRRGARYVDRLLKGAKPAEMPVERLAVFELVIDKSVAASLGVKLPQTVLLRADRVIE